MDRMSWDEMFLEIAYTVAKRSTCRRRQVGAVAVVNNMVVATGYNGAPAGLTHCISTGEECIRQKLNIPSGERQELCVATHSEMNLICQAAKRGVSLDRCTVYCTTHPCSICSRLLINTGVAKIVLPKDESSSYPDELSKKLLKQAGIAVEYV